MPDLWARTADLGLSPAGTLYRLEWVDDGTDHRWTCLGPLGSAEVEPALAGELAELVDRWSDAFDPADEARAAYLRGLPAPGGLGRW